MAREDDPVVYENTPENALRVGWVLVPEYLSGDPQAPFVFHDHHRGRFTYIDATEKEFIELVLTVQ